MIVDDLAFSPIKGIQASHITNYLLGLSRELEILLRIRLFYVTDESALVIAHSS